jgi:glycosyltransferase involved in cell wall biosynthesis
MVSEIQVLAPRLPPDADAAQQLRNGYNVVRFPAFEPIANYPVARLWHVGFWRDLRRVAVRDSYDVLVSHTRFFFTSALALAYHRLTGIPWIHIEHGSDYVQLDSRLAGGLARTYDRLIGRRVLTQADLVVAVSEAVRRFVAELSGRHAELLYRGLDGAALAAAPPDAWVTERAAGRMVIAFVGRLIDGKGVADLICALAAVGDSRVLLCLVGEGPRRSALASLAAERGVGERVAFLGEQPEERVHRIIQASDIVANPSYTEGLPTAVLEAALCGRAIVATDVGGTAEVVKDQESAILVPPRDPPALAAALGALLADPERRARLGENARRAAATRFDRRRSAHCFMALASEVVDARG